MVVRQMGWWTWGAPARSLTRHLHELRHRRLVLERVVERLAINEDGQVVGGRWQPGEGEYGLAEVDADRVDVRCRCV